MNAWPALQVLLFDGWVLRFAGGHTRRANSVNPLYGSTEHVEQKLRRCERFYRNRGLGVVFKMTPHSFPAGLDDLLAREGYEFDAPTSVQTLALDAVGVPSRAAHLEEVPSEAWLNGCYRLNEQLPGEHAQAQRLLHKQLLDNIVPETRFASIAEGGVVVACGMAVLEGGFLGIFDIATAPDHRRRGHGVELMLNLLRWGRRTGADVAYLQVMLDNHPALCLYEKLGFKEAYRYWYRVKG